jgi:hypothetical protein
MSEINRRELILERLRTLFASVDGVRAAYRNKIDAPEHLRPAIVILDADEDVDEEIGDGRGRPVGLAPVICSMSPEIYILAGPSTSGENVGSVLNALRSRLIRAVANDQTLLDLCKDGDIRYVGFATGLAVGRSMEGEAGISFAFRYMLRPDRL